MLDFMIVGLPRSGTTWAANFLTEGGIMCFHDPLYSVHYADWDSELPTRAPEGARVGVSCTGVWRWADWLNAHPARKVVLHRDLGEVQQSMSEIGLPPLEDGAEAALASVLGLHVPFTDLFDEAGCFLIWHHLFGNDVSFPLHRHRELVNVEMQPKFSGLTINPGVTRRLLAELERIAGGW